MPEYCTDSDVIERGAVLGLEISSDPQSSVDEVVSVGIREAGIEIDAVLAQATTAEIARALASPVLKSVAVAIALEWCATYGGSSASETVREGAMNARSTLIRVATRAIDIGLTKPTTLKTTFQSARRVFSG